MKIVFEFILPILPIDAKTVFSLFFKVWEQPLIISGCTPLWD